MPYYSFLSCEIFFFQAEDGIRDVAVTGVQTCALPIFVSRIDTLVDSIIDEKLKAGVDAGQKALLESLRGKVAIANARHTYKKYQELFGGARWQALASKGAQTQRLLWASTSTKNPKFRDVLYVEIG